MKIYSTKDKEYIDNELKKCQMKMDEVYEYLNNTDKKLKTLSKRNWKET